MPLSVMSLTGVGRYDLLLSKGATAAAACHIRLSHKSRLCKYTLRMHTAHQQALTECSVWHTPDEPPPGRLLRSNSTPMLHACCYNICQALPAWHAYASQGLLPNQLKKQLQLCHAPQRCRLNMHSTLQTFLPSVAAAAAAPCSCLPSAAYVELLKKCAAHFCAPPWHRITAPTWTAYGPHFKHSCPLAPQEQQQRQKRASAACCSPACQTAQHKCCTFLCTTVALHQSVYVDSIRSTLQTFLPSGAAAAAPFSCLL
jgi:hypothetical protein